MKNLKLYALVAVLTAGNVGFRLLPSDEGEKGKRVSHLEAGDRVESVELDHLLAWAHEPAACRMVVAFNPDCPFCEAAAERERLTKRSGPYAKPLWITDEERPRLNEFTATLAHKSRHAVDLDAFRALDVEAVPALYLFDREGTIQWVGPYRGDESTEVLAERCGGTAEVPAVAVQVTTVLGQ
jgi:hypothetical protein